MALKDSSFFVPPRVTGDIFEKEQRITFTRPVLQCAVGIVGYDVWFQSDDKNFGRLQVELTSRIADDDKHTVIVKLLYGLRDYSGHYDDPYSGSFYFTVIADLAPYERPAPGTPRADLTITGMEVTQSVQHFRSHKYLRSAASWADNSVPLLRYKNTAVRVYVDYDKYSGLPPIKRIYGKLTVTTPTDEKVIRANSIEPRADRDIMRSEHRHTLNFQIPRTLLAKSGIVQFRVYAYQTDDETQFSADFEQSALFYLYNDVVFSLVGVNYTGNLANSTAKKEELAAPSFQAMVEALDMTLTAFPFSNVQFESAGGNFEGGVIDYHHDADPGDDACDTFGDLLGDLRDLRGDSPNIFVAMTNTGVMIGEGGCGGDGAAVGSLLHQRTIAHEVGHALGLKHAPCDSPLRCGYPPHIDPNFPTYAGYASDSTAEFGYDAEATTDMVYDPQTSFDLMGYTVEGRPWISTYSYLKLLNSATYAFSSRSQAIRQYLDLRLTIDRDRRVSFAPAFHMVGRRSFTATADSSFSIGFLDENRATLLGSTLFEDGHSNCGCGCNSDGWPKRIIHAVPYDIRAKTLVIYEKDEAIFEMPIPKPPAIRLDVAGATDETVSTLLLKWSAGEDTFPHHELTYLVQYLDGNGHWRGVAPRTKATLLKVSKTGVLMKGSYAKLRVLVTSGVATGMAAWEDHVVVGRGARPPPQELHLLGRSETSKLQLTFSHQLSRPDDVEDIGWYDEDGVEIGRGASIDREAIGRHSTVYSVVRHQGPSGVHRWDLEQMKTIN